MSLHNRTTLVRTPAVRPAKTSPGPWDAFADVDVFVDEVLAELTAMAMIEGINSLVQAAKSKARGYRSIRNLKAMVYLLAGKLNMRLPA